MARKVRAFRAQTTSNRGYQFGARNVAQGESTRNALRHIIGGNLDGGESSVRAGKGSRLGGWERPNTTAMTHVCSRMPTPLNPHDSSSLHSSCAWLCRLALSCLFPPDALSCRYTLPSRASALSRYVWYHAAPSPWQILMMIFSTSRQDAGRKSHTYCYSVYF